ncbi:CHAD domain-containing protein [Inquilinus limosus]|uniref:CYTH and CHAD domain-containing protein n=1 Tax=Inquilinus limosus TaxID=171674 RepID=UPI003F1569BD
MPIVQPDRPNEQTGGGDQPPPAPLEIELKLRAASEDLERLRRAELLTRVAAGPGTARSLTSFYYDTPDCALQRRGVTLRVRRIGQRFVQTLKTERRGDGLARGEWEVALPAMVPAPDAFDDPEAKALLDGVPVDALAHLFTTRIQRETRILSLPDAVVECAFDTGTIETRDASDPVAEIELELKEGRTAALYRLALSFLDEVPLRVSEVTKAERGYRLVARRPPGVMYDPKTPLTSRMTVDEAIATVLARCLRHWTANEAAAEDGGDPGGVHQMRVALRRLRSALALFKKTVPSPTLDWLRDEAKWLAGALGPARDWDVFLNATVAPLESLRPEDPGIGVLRAAAMRQREAGYAAVRQALADPRCTRLHLTLGEWLERRGWRDHASTATLTALVEPIDGLAGRLIARAHRKVATRGRHLAQLDPHQRHQVRIALKRLRYAMDFFRPLYPDKRAKPFATQLSRLQDAFGHLNDVATAEALLQRLTGESADPALHRAAGMVLGWHARGAESSGPELLAQWDAFRAVRPFWTRE